MHMEFRPEGDAAVFAAVPAAPAVFLLRGHDPQAEPYVSKTANLRRRLLRLLGPAEERTRRLNLRERVARIEYAPTGSDFESGFVLYKTLREVFPKTYQDRLRLRMAPLVRMHMDNRYPRASVTTHLSGTRSGSVFYGPFPSRAAAEKFTNDALDFFKMRRCVDELNPDPKFPGCVYSEMKMCLAPCFQGCTDEAYAAEVTRVEAFLESRGHSLVREISAARDKASSDLEFESAAALHTQLEKLKPVVAQLPEIVHRLDRLRALMVQPSARPDSVTLFRIEGGCIADSVAFEISTRPPASATPSATPLRPEAGATKKPHSMESRILETLAAAPPIVAASRQETMEHLAILKRWYFRSSKAGEIFFADESGELPMRRVVRGISRVFRGEKPADDLSETTRDYWVNRGKEAELS
ncbi:MAG: UvrB/UvrC motif-containing protein [Terriglobales bacterium]